MCEGWGQGRKGGEGVKGGVKGGGVRERQRGGKYCEGVVGQEF